MKNCLMFILRAMEFHIFFENGEFHINAKINGLRLTEKKDEG